MITVGGVLIKKKVMIPLIMVTNRVTIIIRGIFLLIIFQRLDRSIVSSFIYIKLLIDKLLEPSYFVTFIWITPTTCYYSTEHISNLRFQFPFFAKVQPMLCHHYILMPKNQHHAFKSEFSRAIITIYLLNLYKSGKDNSKRHEYLTP